MIFLTISLGALVTLDEDAQGNITYIYTHEDHKKVEAALTELKEYRVKFPALEYNYKKLFESRTYWISEYEDKVKDIGKLKVQRDILTGSLITVTVVAVILGILRGVEKK